MLRIIRKKATKEELRVIILDIAMNLNSIGNWAADDYPAKKKRIITFLGQTSHYITDLSGSTFSPSFEKTFQKFLSEYPQLEREGKTGPKNHLVWAERMMTWGNILTHRTKLL